MPSVNIPDIGTVNFPDSMSAEDITAAIERDILPNKVKYGIQSRAISPPLSARGDPNPERSTTLGDVAGAAGRGTLDLLGGVPDSVGQWAGDVATMGATRVARNAIGMGKDLMEGHVPIIGRPIENVLKPAGAALNNRPVTRNETLSAVRSGTTLAEGAALSSPTVARTLGGAGAALEEAGARQLPAEGAPLQQGPPAPLGQVVASRGRVINPTADIEVPKFNNAARHGDQLAALTEKYPNSDILDNGSNFVVKAEKGAATVTGPEMPHQIPAPPQPSMSAGDMLSTAVGAVRHPIMTAASAALKLGEMQRSPLWNVVSGKLKAAAGKALQSGTDYAPVAALSGLIEQGQGSDEFGHDTALHSLVQQVDPSGSMPGAQRSRALQDYDAIYVMPNGTQIQIPHQILRSVYDALSGLAIR
jgi:hypothetical protein